MLAILLQVFYITIQNRKFLNEIVNYLNISILPTKLALQLYIIVIAVNIDRCCIEYILTATIFTATAKFFFFLHVVISN